MGAAQPSREKVRFDAFVLDLRAGELRKHGIRIKLQDQPFQILQILLEHPADVVTRDELQQRLWPADTFVDFEHGLYNAIQRLREALGDSAETPRYIETLSRRGYRFIAPVTNGNRDEGKVEAARTGTPVAVISERSAPHRRLWISVLVAASLAAVVLLLAVAFKGGSFRGRLLGKDASPPIRSLAVLPLQNLSNDINQEYFADGMTDALITDLAQVNSLKVISRTSTMRYKKSDKSLPEIARELNVDGIVEGTVQRSGGRVRITAQLIYAPTDKLVWADTFDREQQDTLALQSTVARAIADQIRVEMTPRERSRLQDPRPVNLGALEAYLQGQYHAASIGEGSSFEERYRAVEYFREAIRQDPSFSRAYVGLATALIQFVSPAPKDAPFVKDALEKAITLDPDSSEAHVWMARYKEFHDWDFPAAEREFRRAIELDRNNAGAHDFYGNFLDLMGRLPEGAIEEQRAQELDPGDDHLMDGYNLRGEYARVLEISRNVVATHPTDGIFRHYLFMAYLHNGRDKEAVEQLQQTVILYGHPELAAPLAQAYAFRGRQGFLRLWAKDLEQLHREGVPPVIVAQVYALIGDADNAFTWLEKGYLERDGFLLLMKVDPDWASFRSDPRFQDLMRRIGLPP
jgi:TolB-like protein/DNA-binding winged helix-turn-helix (wHTH) protein